MIRSYFLVEYFSMFERACNLREMTGEAGGREKRGRNREALLLGVTPSGFLAARGVAARRSRARSTN